MARVGDLVNLSDDAIAGAAEWYKRKPVPAAFKCVHPEVRRRAYVLADKDWRRCVLDESDPDHPALTVHDQIMWQYEVSNGK